MAQAIAAKYSRIILQKRCKNETENCSICLESLYMKPVIYLPCKHFFHQTCLNQAFEKKLYTCPLCRYDLVEALTKINFKFPVVYTPYYTYYNDYNDDYSDMPYLVDSDVEEDIHIWTGLFVNIMQDPVLDDSSVLALGAAVPGAVPAVPAALGISFLDFLIFYDL